MFVLCVLDVTYREPVVRTHDQLSYIGPERAYQGAALNLPVPVNLFLPPVPQPFQPQPMPMGQSCGHLEITIQRIVSEIM